MKTKIPSKMRLPREPKKLRQLRFALLNAEVMPEIQGWEAEVDKLTRHYSGGLDTADKELFILTDRVKTGAVRFVSDYNILAARLVVDKIWSALSDAEQQANRDISRNSTPVATPEQRAVLEIAKAVHGAVMQKYAPKNLNSQPKNTQGTLFDDTYTETDFAKFYADFNAFYLGMLSGQRKRVDPGIPGRVAATTRPPQR